MAAHNTVGQACQHLPVVYFYNTYCHKGQGDIITPVYNIKGAALENIDSYKDLGVTVDSHLKFDKHDSEKVNKAYTMLGILRRNFKDVSYECFYTYINQW